MHRFRNILAVCEDGASQALLDRLRRLAAAGPTRVMLVLVAGTQPGELAHLVSEVAGQWAQDLEEQVLDLYRARLADLARPLRLAGAEVRTAVEQGPAALQLIRRVLRDGHDLLIKDVQREADWPFLRRLDMQLLRKCPCPVWILNGPADAGAERILAAVDTMSGDPAHEALNRKVVELAASLSREDGGLFDLVSVWNLPGEAALREGRIRISGPEIEAVVARHEAASAHRLDRLVQDVAPDGVRMRVLHLKGRPAESLLRHVEGERIETLVMGTVARTGIAGYLIGTTAETVLSRVTCSVLALKPPGFATPVRAEPEAELPVPVGAG